jgi:flagellar basal-body rod protein FlgB
MPLEDIVTFQVLKAKLDYTNARQKVIAQNVANADTPNYVPSDLRTFSFEVAMKQAANTGLGGAVIAGPSRPVTMVRTNPGHMSAPKTAAGDWRADVKPDSEARLDGNQVVLEDEMAKMTETRLDQEAAITFYQQSLTLLRTAAKAPGK